MFFYLSKKIFVFVLFIIHFYVNYFHERFFLFTFKVFLTQIFSILMIEKLNYSHFFPIAKYRNFALKFLITIDYGHYQRLVYTQISVETYSIIQFLYQLMFIKIGKMYIKHIVLCIFNTFFYVYFANYSIYLYFYIFNE